MKKIKNIDISKQVEFDLFKNEVNFKVVKFDHFKISIGLNRIK